MTDEKVIQLLKIEHQCSQANCDRNCSECKLVQKQETLDEMYTRAVEIIKENKQLKAKIETVKKCLLANQDMFKDTIYLYRNRQKSFEHYDETLFEYLGLDLIVNGEKE